MELFTPLTPAECVERLSAAMDDERWHRGYCSSLYLLFGGEPPKHFAGRVSLTRLCVRIVGTCGRVSRARLSARLQPQASGTVTVITGIFRPAWFEWVGILCLVGFLMRVAFTIGNDVWAAVFMLSALAAAFRLTRSGTVQEQEAIQDFLNETSWWKRRECCRCDFVVPPGCCRISGTP